MRSASRLREFPETTAAFQAGELSEDQVAVITRHAPASIDAEAADLARSATVAQISRVLSKYSFDDAPAKAEPEPSEEEARRVSFGPDDSGQWRLSAVLPPDEGAVVERALTEARDELFRAGEHGNGPHPSPADVSWADALVAMAEKSLAAEAVARPHRDRHLVMLHLGTDGQGHLHLGPGVPDGMRRFLSCDSRVRAVFEREGRPVNVGRAFRTVPDRTRIVVEERDRGCRVPGCERSRWLHVHHVRHWEDGGTTDTWNLIALCQHHHRLHHRGGLGIEGNADDPDGVIFTDHRGRRLANSGRPAPPGDRPPPPGKWTHPTGERLHPHDVYFDERLRTA